VRVAVAVAVGLVAGVGVGGGGGDVKAPFTTYAYDVLFVLAPAFVLATSNSRFYLSFTNRW
jgi:hypothetical protein